MVAAKNDLAHESLSRQFKAGNVGKRYLALVHGRIGDKKKVIDLPIGRHWKNRKKMSVLPSGGRRAVTFWTNIEEFPSGFSLLSVSIKTGRTHQIRVHLSHMGHPVVGDQLYGFGRRWWKRHPLSREGIMPLINRQMLHAFYLSFSHPGDQRHVEFEASIPDDMAQILHILRFSDGQRS
jgi:23S rRNA pseudouridine1911/1915/1917 synthase